MEIGAPAQGDEDGLLEGEAVELGEARLGRQQPRLVIGERQVDPRHPEHRHLVHAHGGVHQGGALRLGVDRGVRRANAPAGVRPVALAGHQVGVLQRPVVTRAGEVVGGEQEGGLPGGHQRLGRVEGEKRVLIEPLLPVGAAALEEDLAHLVVVELHRGHLGHRRHQAAAQQAHRHVADAGGELPLAVVGDLVGGHRRVVGAQGGVALGDGELFLVAVNHLLGSERDLSRAARREGLAAVGLRRRHATLQEQDQRRRAHQGPLIYQRTHRRFRVPPSPTLRAPSPARGRGVRGGRTRGSARCRPGWRGRAPAP